MKQRNRYGDLEAMGYGSRVTVWRKVRAEKFPPPYIDESGNPFWTPAQLTEHDAKMPLAVVTANKAAA